MRHGLSGLTLETRPEQSEGWETIWARDIKQLRHWIKMRRAVDETKTELRCIYSTNGEVCLTSTVFRHSMTALSTLPFSHLLTASSMHSYHSSKRLKKLRIKGFCESICKHSFCRYIDNSLKRNFLSNFNIKLHT